MQHASRGVIEKGGMGFFSVTPWPRFELFNLD